MSNHLNKIQLELLSITQQFLRELEAERALQAVTLDASLERDLGIDSLGKVELLHRMEKYFSVKFPEKVLIEANSLRDIIQYLEQDTASPKFKRPTMAPVSEPTTLDLSSATTLTTVLIERAAKEPERPHIYLQKEGGDEIVIRYGELLEKASQIAKGLCQRGIQPEETVAIMLPTSPDFFYSFFGVLLCGAIPVPIYPPFRPDRIEDYAKREAKILQNAEARLLITFSQVSTLSKILRTFIPSLKEVITADDLKTTERIDHKPIHADDAALIQYTSGSTGDPKGVLITHTNVLANIRAIGAVIPILPTDAGVSWLPLYHDMGLMSWLGALYFGIPVTILSPMTFLTRPEQWLWAIHRHRATISGAPNFAYELCIKKINTEDIEGLDLSSWRFAFNGAEPVNPLTMEKFYKKFSPSGFQSESFAPVYGLAETTVGLTFPTQRRIPRVDKIERDIFQTKKQAQPISSQNQDFLEFVSCGEPLPQHEIRIVDDTNQLLAERNVGNIQFKGPSAMRGYFNNVTSTQKAYHAGWWDTGDLGYIVNNELFITGRKKDLIIKAGRNLYPEEIEGIVSQIPNVRKGCIVAFGMSDPNTGTEKLIVIAETYAQDKKNLQQIRANIIERLAIDLGEPPDQVLLVPPRTIPKTSSGKLQRSQAKQDYLEGKIIHKQRFSAKIQMVKLLLSSNLKKLYSKLVTLGKLLYSVYVGIILLVTLPFLWILVIVASQRKKYQYTRFWARNIFRLAFIPITIMGKENMPQNLPTIFVANHASYIDSILLLGLLPAGTLFVAKKELLQAPIIRTFIKKLRFLTVDRLDFSQSLVDMKHIEQCIKNKSSILIFPEGTFTYATGLRRFKLGAFNLSVETGLPICPIAIQGSRSILRGDNRLLQPGSIKITLGKPITPLEKNWNEVVRLHLLARNEIAMHCGELVLDLVSAGFKKD